MVYVQGYALHIIFFVIQKIWDKLIIFSFVDCTSGVIPKKSAYPKVTNIFFHVFF